jgi:hypothetical protein
MDWFRNYFEASQIIDEHRLTGPKHFRTGTYNRGFGHFLVNRLMIWK